MNFKQVRSLNPYSNNGLYSLVKRRWICNIRLISSSSSLSTLSSSRPKPNSMFMKGGVSVIKRSVSAELLKKWYLIDENTFSQSYTHWYTIKDAEPLHFLQKGEETKVFLYSYSFFLILFSFSFFFFFFIFIFVFKKLETKRKTKKKTKKHL